MNRTWSDEEKEFIRQHSDILKDKEIQEHLSKIRGKHIPIQCVRKQRRSLGILKQQGRGKCKILSTNTPINKPDAEEKAPSCVSANEAQSSQPKD